MRALAKIWVVLTPAERKSAIGLFGLSIIGMVLETLGVGFVIPAIALLMQDDLGARFNQIRPLLEAAGSPSQTALTVGGMLVLVTIYLVKNAFLGYFLWRQNRFTNETKAELSRRLFVIYLRQPYVFHLQRNSAQLIRNVSGEASSFTGMLTHAVIFLTEMLVLGGMAILLVAVEPLGTLIVGAVLGGASWMFHHFSRIRIARWGLARQYHDGMILQHLQQGLGGAKEVKLLGREDDFVARFQTHNLASMKATEHQATLTQLPRLWLEFLAVAGLAALVITMLAQERPMVSILPRLGLFGAAAFRIMPSVGRLLAAVQGLRFGRPSIDTLFAELNRPLAEPPPLVEGSASLQHEILVKDVTFTYPGAAAPTLRALNLKIQKGESVGFVGPSGSGKSTLIDLMLGLLTPDSGDIAIDGRSLATHLRNWQRQIGYVPQAIYLTDDSLRRNVAFGLADAEIDAAAVERALRSAQLEEFVATLPQGLETEVGERGVRLSGGQRQRIGIARALYHDPTVLVLDEATSALDAATESGVMDAVIALHSTKTIVIVAHRLSTVAHCDRIYRLEHGRAEEQSSAHGPTTAKPNA